MSATYYTACALFFLCFSYIMEVPSGYVLAMGLGFVAYAKTRPETRKIRVTRLR